ncbi:MAG: hypothetical protein QXS54_01380 [Candidatus Methanomethylicaceae archaeon]
MNPAQNTGDQDAEDALDGPEARSFWISLKDLLCWSFRSYSRSGRYWNCHIFGKRKSEFPEAVLSSLPPPKMSP